ncbi:hypothetical protein [Streptodolium elevatio]|uniref:Uncharacterized protein n=1 Tax=Streptodolium elevatio TaxID=3157996 RepID=A0ABV3DNV6_9ACTN
MTDTRNVDFAFRATDFLGFVAPMETAKPTDMTPLTAPWVCLGWLAKTGGQFESTEERVELEAAGEVDPIASSIIKVTRPVKFSADEAMSPLIRALLDNVALSDVAPGVDGIAAYDLPSQPRRRRYAWIFAAIEAGGKAMWRYMPAGEVTGRAGDNNGTDAYTVPEFTVTGFKSPTGMSALSHLLDYGTADLGAFFSSEQQQVAITGTPTGGTFTLTFDGETTSGIAYNATAANVKTALEALPNVEAGDITATGGALPGTPVVVTFGGSLSGTNVAQMTGSAASLTGGTTPAVVVTTTAGGAVSMLD